MPNSRYLSRSDLVLIQVNFNSGEPVTRQVVAQIKWMVASGKLQPGEKLPSVRDFSKQLKVNPTTVTRIYGELSAESVIVLRQGQGAFVSTQSTTTNRAEARKQVRELIRRMLSEAVRLGMSEEAIQKFIATEIKKISKDNS